MANWAWPHTPASYFARLDLRGGPLDNEQAGFLPPNIAPPVQIAWATWGRLGFICYLYEWHGERGFDHGRTDSIIYRWGGRTVPPEDVPPVVSAGADVYADAADLLVTSLDVPREMIWPGL